MISVVIPTRDRWPRLAASLGSALAQTDVAFEVIVVDDASAEPPPAGLDDDDRIAYVRQPEPRGTSAARNRGVRSGRGDWIAFLDDRDLWAPDHLATLMQVCDRQQTDFAYCASWVVDDDCRIRWFRNVPAGNAIRRRLLLENALGSPSCLVARRTLWERAGGFDEWLSTLAPWDLWIRWSRSGRACMSREATVAAAEAGEISRTDVDDEHRELRELRRRYRHDARREGVRFGAALPPRRRPWERFLGRRAERPAPAPLETSPPWLAALANAVPDGPDARR